jgi:hypothetical protein
VPSLRHGLLDRAPQLVLRQLGLEAAHDVVHVQQPVAVAVERRKRAARNVQPRVHVVLLQVAPVNLARGQRGAPHLAAVARVHLLQQPADLAGLQPVLVQPRQRERRRVAIHRVSRQLQLADYVLHRLAVRVLQDGVARLGV